MSNGKMFCDENCYYKNQKRCFRRVLKLHPASWNLIISLFISLVECVTNDANSTDDFYTREKHLKRQKEARR